MMFEKFVREERAQGAIEYILLAGGIIVAAIVVFNVYSSMVRTAGQRLNSSTQNASATMESKIQEQVNSI